MKIITMSAVQAVESIGRGELILHRDDPGGHEEILDAIDQDWPIGLMTAVRQGMDLVVMDGARRLAAITQALTGPGFTRILEGDAGWVREPTALPGVPGHVLIRTIDFLKWAHNRPERHVGEAHDVAARLHQYMIPFAVVTGERAALREYLDRRVS